MVKYIPKADTHDKDYSGYQMCKHQPQRIKKKTDLQLHTRQKKTNFTLLDVKCQLYFVLLLFDVSDSDDNPSPVSLTFEVPA